MIQPVQPVTPRPSLLSAALFVLLALAAPLLAIQPGRWAHTTEADFEPGKKDNTVVTNLGEIKLAAANELVSKMPEKADVIYDLQAIKDGSLYLAAGPEAKLLKHNPAAEKDEDKIQQVLELKDEQIFALDVTAEGELLMAISSGKTSRLAVLDKDGKAQTLVELEGVRYVWDMHVAGKQVYLATGTEGKLLLAELGGEKPTVTELLDAAQPNLLCLGRDGQGRLYAGSDTDGLVYRVTPRQAAEAVNGGKLEYDVFVLYDAIEPEIGALLVTQDGTVYAGTAAANQARPGRLSGAAAAETGRPSEQPEPPAEEPAEPDEQNGKPAPTPTDDAKPQQPPPAEPQPKGDAPPAPNETPKDAPADAPKDAPKDAPQDGNDHADKAADQSAVIGITPTPLAEGDGKPAESTPPTAEQRDQLRQEIRRRLQAARESGQLPGQPMQQDGPGRPGQPQPGGGRPGGPPQQQQAGAAKPGNAVYKIDPEGFVSEVFRETVMVLRLAMDGDSLLVATGNEGQLYRIDAQKEETIILADLEPQQVPALSVGDDGSIVLGTANPAQLVVVQKGFAKTGEYTSSVLDAVQISLWGTLKVTGQVPADTTIAIATRSGNVADPDKAPWSAWSKPQVINPQQAAVPLAPVELRVQSPPARFLQYKVTLTGNGAAGSVVDQVQIAYVLPNLKPEIASLQAAYNPQRSGGQPGGQARPPAPQGGSPSGGESAELALMNIQWQAADPNNDNLIYTLEYRGAGTDTWLPLAEDQTQNRFVWDTRRVPDGRYVIRLTASDAPDNTPDMALSAARDSNPVLIDNTPPTIENLQVQQANGVVTLTATLKDALSDLQQVHYAVDSTDEWKPAVPDDLIFDSTTEQVTVKLTGLAAGSHVVTLRVSDAQGNTVYRAMPVTVGK